jgi:Spy/CpxP family protein refolding chaperone
MRLLGQKGKQTNSSIMKKQIILLALAVVFSMPLLAQQRPMQERARRLAERPDREAFLTEQQKEQVKALRMEHQKNVTPLQNELKELRARQNSLMSVDSPDRGAINGVLENINSIQGQLQKMSVEQRLAFRELLTEEQRIKIDAMKAKGPRRGERGERPFRGNPGERGRMPQRR